jgi:hypothetical protein
MKACCAWCLCIVTMPDTFDPKDPNKDVVCTKECAENERRFRMYYSDELIGLRNFEQHGVNPNQRGNHGKKAKDT